jgi:RNA polymerase sigma-70 factor (ECF subfamily)
MRAHLRAVGPNERSDVDDATLERAQRGDPVAFRVLVVCHQPAVFAYLWRMLGGDRAAVEDLVQETFVRVHRGLPRFARGGPATLRTWILTIATRVALNELRRRRPRTEPIDARARAVEEPRTDATLALIVRDALDQMTPDHRAVLVLREYHDLDYAEIASVLGIDVGTVRSRLSRARAALRAELGEEP